MEFGVSVDKHHTELLADVALGRTDVHESLLLSRVFRVQRAVRLWVVPPGCLTWRNNKPSMLPKLPATSAVVSVTRKTRTTCASDTPPSKVTRKNTGSAATAMANTSSRLAKSLPRTSSQFVRRVMSSRTNVRRSFSCETALAEAELAEAQAAGDEPEEP